ncbi:hypothetical protein V1514DRAFT_366595 [Lipomyces japonicus]|uniref:uncharacterized protein n=1 Tax=Lipomyces japonicus TaxID=56871 RepID=UPI0034CECF5A
MDLVLEACDTFVFDWVYAKLFPLPSTTTTTAWSTTYTVDILLFKATPTAYMTTVPRTSLTRILLSLFLITWGFGLAVYFLFAAGTYVLVFDKRACDHPKDLKNQVRLEILQAVRVMPVMAALMVPCTPYSRPQMAAQVVLFLALTDMGIYFIHRGLHHPHLYRYLHKPHHKWIVPTPFASYAFHPLDGYLQSLPYHILPYVLPLHKTVYISLFGFINFWTIMIHDGEYLSNNPIVNGSACHAMHHLYFNYNYGQFTTLWDRIVGSYRKPDQSLFDAKTKMASNTWQLKSTEMERIVKLVEHDDSRVYLHPDKIKKAT